MKPILLSCLLTILVLPSYAQNRPIPYPVIPSPQFNNAVERGTRTLTGLPGENYWTNTAEYTISATLGPSVKEADRKPDRDVYQQLAGQPDAAGGAPQAKPAQGRRHTKPAPTSHGRSLGFLLFL